MPRIVWPEHSGEVYQQIELPVGDERSFLLAQLRAQKQVADFFDTCLEFASDSMLLPRYFWKDVKLQDFFNFESIGAFNVANFMYENDTPHIFFSEKWYLLTLNFLVEYLLGHIHPNQDIQGKPAKLVIAEMYAKFASNLAHEMYHYRQAFHAPEFMEETRSDNMLQLLLHHIMADDDFTGEIPPELYAYGQRRYLESRGERGAKGYSMRFLVEMKRNLLAKQDHNRSLVEKLFLMGVDTVLQEKIANTQQMYQQNKFEKDADSLTEE